MATLDLFAQLESLKKERNTVILTHCYQDPDIQDVTDCLGDSFDLAQQATLENIHTEITLPEDLCLKALTPLEKMLVLS